MKKNKIIIFAVELILCVGVYAQRQEVRSSSDTTRNMGERNIGWIRSHILDNWFIEAQFGGQLYYGFEDRKGPFFDRLTPQVEGHVGRWVFPMLGYRFVAGMGRGRGFVTTESYDAYRPFHGYGTSYGTSGGGDALGGYYWPVDGDNTLYMQKWNYVHGGADLLINLSFLKKYNKIDLKSKWNHIAYAGVDIRVGLSENHPEIAQESNRAAEGHIGYILRYNLNKHFALYGDIRLSIIEGAFDRELVPNVEFMRPDLMLNGHLGLTFDFNFRREAKRRQYYMERGVLTYGNEMPKHVAFVQVEDVKYIRIMDTLTLYNIDTLMDENAQAKVDSLQKELDKIMDDARGIPADMPLDSILQKQMLPYEMVFFDLDKWDIRASEEMKIARMARLMKAYPNQKFILSGSADAKTGTVKRNIFLGHTRADVVYNQLTIKYGIKPEQLTREYLGGIADYDPYPLNRTTVIIMDHPAVRRAFEKMKSQRKAGSGVAEF